MGYAQWAAFKIINRGKAWAVSIKNAEKSWGKFYDGPNKDNEIGEDRVNQINIDPQNEAVIWACGRSDTSSGTEGTFDLYDGNIKIATIYWSCPWSGSNVVETRDASDDYLVMVGNVSSSGPIGDIDIKVGKVA